MIKHQTAQTLLGRSTASQPDVFIVIFMKSEFAGPTSLCSSSVRTVKLKPIYRRSSNGSVVKSGQTIVKAALSRLPERSLSGAPPPRSIRTPIRACRINTPLFRNRYQPEKHYIVPVALVINVCIGSCLSSSLLNIDQQGKHTSTNGNCV